MSEIVVFHEIQAPIYISEFLFVTARFPRDGWRNSHSPLPFKMQGKTCVRGAHTDQ